MADPRGAGIIGKWLQDSWEALKGFVSPKPPAQEGTDKREPLLPRQDQPEAPTVLRTDTAPPVNPTPPVNPVDTNKDTGGSSATGGSDTSKGLDQDLALLKGVMPDLDWDGLQEWRHNRLALDKLRAESAGVVPNAEQQTKINDYDTKLNNVKTKIKLNDKLLSATQNISDAIVQQSTKEDPKQALKEYIKQNKDDAKVKSLVNNALGKSIDAGLNEGDLTDDKLEKIVAHAKKVSENIANLRTEMDGGAPQQFAAATPTTDKKADTDKKTDEAKPEGGSAAGAKAQEAPSGLVAGGGAHPDRHMLTAARFFEALFKHELAIFTFPIAVIVMTALQPVLAFAYALAALATAAFLPVTWQQRLGMTAKGLLGDSATCLSNSLVALTLLLPPAFHALLHRDVQYMPGGRSFGPAALFNLLSWIPVIGHIFNPASPLWQSGMGRTFADTILKPMIAWAAPGSSEASIRNKHPDGAPNSVLWWREMYESDLKPAGIDNAKANRAGEHKTTPGSTMGGTMQRGSSNVVTNDVTNPSGVFQQKPTAVNQPAVTATANITPSPAAPTQATATAPQPVQLRVMPQQGGATLQARLPNAKRPNANSLRTSFVNYITGNAPSFSSIRNQGTAAQNNRQATLAPQPPHPPI